MTLTEEISLFLQRGSASKVKEKVELALSQGVSPTEILEKGLVDGMTVIGDKFKENEVFVPEVLLSARAMSAGIELLRPYLISEGTKSKGTVVIGTIRGDLHDIGKRIVKIMMEGKGLEVIDLGTDVLPETFLQKAQEYHADVICCSSLLTTTMMEIKKVVDKRNKEGLQEKIKIMIGGAPITQAFCEKIGADYYTEDASSAADVALKICTENRNKKK